MTSVTPRVGVSSCLLGEGVRYDGAHKRDAFLADEFGPCVTWVPVCPEVEIGLPVPRPAVHLSRHGDDVHLVEPKSGNDHTKAMLALADERLASFRAEGLHGFVFKARSPSCGIGDAPLTNEQGYESGMRSGVFAERVRRAWPELPVISEGMLVVPDQREAFLARVFAGARIEAVDGADALAAFHAAHATMLASRLKTPDERFEELSCAGDVSAYADRFRSVMARVPSRRGHVRALRRAAGDAPADAVAAKIETYAAGKSVLSEAVTAVRESLGDASASDAYLHPHPLAFEMYAAL